LTESFTTTSPSAALPRAILAH